MRVGRYPLSVLEAALRRVEEMRREAARLRFTRLCSA